MFNVNLTLFCLDHGLYVTLSPEFRSKYSQLWYAIFIQDLPTIHRICEGWGIGQAELFASATLLRPWRAKASKRSGSNELNGGLVGTETRSKIDQSHKTIEQLQLEAQRELKAKLKTFLLNVELLPKEILFVGRAMRILQANNQAMGACSRFAFLPASHLYNGYETIAG